jgi:hypothetical protein
MKRNISSIVSGAGWIAGFITALFKALRNLGVSEEAIHGLAAETDAGTMMVERIAGVIKAFSDVSIRTLAVETIATPTHAALSWNLWIEDRAADEETYSLSLSIAEDPVLCCTTHQVLDLVLVQFTNPALGGIVKCDVDACFSALGLSHAGVGALLQLTKTLEDLDEAGAFVTYGEVGASELKSFCMSRMDDGQKFAMTARSEGYIYTVKLGFTFVGVRIRQVVRLRQ